MAAQITAQFLLDRFDCIGLAPRQERPVLDGPGRQGAQEEEDFQDLQAAVAQADGLGNMIEFIKEVLHGLIFLHDDAEIRSPAKAVAQGLQIGLVFFEEAVQNGLGLLGFNEQGQAVIMGNREIRRMAVFTAAALADGHVAFPHI